jgi:hypothetical protein
MGRLNRKPDPARVVILCHPSYRVTEHGVFKVENVG